MLEREAGGLNLDGMRDFAEHSEVPQGEKHAPWRLLQAKHAGYGGLSYFIAVRPTPAVYAAL